MAGLCHRSCRLQPPRGLPSVGCSELNSPNWLRPWRSQSLARAFRATRLEEIPGAHATEADPFPAPTPPSMRPPMRPPMRLLDHATAPGSLEGIDTMLFDCDGVLWHGSTLIPGAKEALEIFRARGKRMLFVTNNSSKGRATYVKKFHDLGLDVDVSQIVSSSYAAAAYLSSLGFRKKVFLIGNGGVEEELHYHGIPFVGGEDDMALPNMRDASVIRALEVDPDIGAVVVGWDPCFTYQRMVYASVCLRELPGCLFVATNTDSADTLGGLRMMPGTGGLVSAVQIASGAVPFVVGKEGPWLLGHLVDKFGVDPARTCMIGDRLDTDVAMGKAGGLRTILTLSGVSTLDDAEAAHGRGEGPDVVVRGVAVLAGIQV